MFRVAERDEADADANGNILDMTFFKAKEVDSDDGNNNRSMQRDCFFYVTIV